MNRLVGLLSFALVLVGAFGALHWSTDATSSAALDPVFEAQYAVVSHLVPREDFAATRPVHRRMLADLIEHGAWAGSPAAACWAGQLPPTSVMNAFTQGLRGTNGGDLFNAVDRWTATATNGGGLQQGNPITITYSFVPDGTTIPDGGSSFSSNLFATLNADFGGNTALWQSRIQQAFDRWGELCGINYVFEPNDDGATHGSAGGQLGVRGDVRIGARPIDGGSGVLAYNFFPNNGDMVLDSGDFWGSNTNNGRFFRNVIAHEHGHGMGLAHVCPQGSNNNTRKLMAPFLSTQFDGPRHDDIIASQRLYGDNLENNDTTAQATDLGFLGNGTQTIADVSIDDDSDVDFYQFAVGAGKKVTATVRPIGFTYQSGVQTQACNTGTTINTLITNDLGVQVLATNGTTVLGTANLNPAGVVETLNDVNLIDGAGNYFIRVFGGNVNNVQAYELDVTIADTILPPFSITFPLGVPATVDPDVTSTVSVQTLNGTGSPDPTTAVLFTSINGGPFNLAGSLTDLGNGSFEATLPAQPCFDTINWYVSIQPTGGGAAVVGPEGAPTFNSNQTEVIGGNVINLAAFNFQTTAGWTVTNSGTLTDGAWGAGAPVGGGDRGDPPVDADGSGACFLTDNVDGNSDVDGGSTTLTSPVFDLSGESSVAISFQMWHDNDFGGNPNSDPLSIQISDNGGVSWVTIENYFSSVDQWVSRTIRVTDHVALTNQVQMRFVASDFGGPSVVESGIDDFRVQVCAAFPTLDDPCAAGNTGLLQGGPYNPLTINLLDGGMARRVDFAVGSTLVFFLNTPPATIAQSSFIIWGKAGIPGPGDQTVIPDGIGTMCIPPCVLSPADPTLFTLATNLTDPCTTLFQVAAPTPWIQSIPGGLPVPGQFTFQGVMINVYPTGPRIEITNALILNVF